MRWALMLVALALAGCGDVHDARRRGELKYHETRAEWVAVGSTMDSFARAHRAPTGWWLLTVTEEQGSELFWAPDVPGAEVPALPMLPKGGAK